MLARGTQGQTAVCSPAPLNLNQNDFIFNLLLFLELNKNDGLDFSHVSGGQSTAVQVFAARLYQHRHKCSQPEC